MSESVIAALLAAIEAAPADADLRAHVASLLRSAGRDDEALVHVDAGLRARPDHVELLALIVELGPGAGRDVEGHRRILDALRGGGAPTAPDGGTPPDDPVDPIPVAATDVPSTVDELVAAWEQQDAPPEPDIGAFSRPGERLDDVGGMEAAKQRIERSFLAPMRNPDLQRAFGKAAGGGLVLWGPPGCGKTFLARALAGELGANFYEVGLDDVLDMWIGNSEKNLSAIFEFARRNAPCVLFFDELDAIGQKRSHLRHSAGMRGVINQLLSELDGATSTNDGVFFLAATNHPWDLDPALVRPGRFDRRLLVLPPDLEARRRIFDVHLRDRPVDDSIDVGKLAKQTDGFSGADIRLVIDDATEHALGASADAGRVVAISQAMLMTSLRDVKPSIGPWLATARNYATFANDDGDLDELVAYLKKHR